GGDGGGARVRARDRQVPSLARDRTLAGCVPRRGPPMTALRAIPDAELESALSGIGRRVDFPELPDLSGLVARQIVRATRSQRRSQAVLRPVIRPVWQPAWQRVAVALVVLVSILAGT